MNADQVQGVQANIDAVLGNVGKHSADFFIFWFKKSPEMMAKFPNYSGKAPDSLPSVGAFGPHSKAVVVDVMATFAIAHDAGALAQKGKELVRDHVPRKVASPEFTNLVASLLPFLEQTLGGSYHKSGWTAASTLVLAALK